MLEDEATFNLDEGLDVSGIPGDADTHLGEDFGLEFLKKEEQDALAEETEEESAEKSAIEEESDESKVEEESAEAKKVEEKEEEEKESPDALRIKELETQNQFLRDDLLKRTEGLQEITKGIEEEAEKKPEKKSEEVSEEAPTSFTLTDDLYDKALESRESFVKVLNDFAQHLTKQVVEHTVNQLREDTLLSVPASVNKAVDERLYIQQANEKFYREHPELVPFVAVQRELAAKLDGEHPEWTLEQLLEASGKATIAYLKEGGFDVAKEAEAKKEKEKASAKTTKKPAFSKGGTSSGGSKVDLEGFDKEAADLFREPSDL